MSKKTQKILKEIVKRLKAYKPEKIILFGSAGRGEKRIGDLDLFIIKDTNKNFSERYVEVSSMLDHTIPLDIIVYTPKEFNHCRKIGDYLVGKILKEGKTIYETK